VRTPPDHPPWDDVAAAPARPGPPPHVPPPPAPPVSRLVALTPRLQAALSAALVAAMVFWVAGAWVSGRPPHRSELLAALTQEPVQTASTAAPFSFEHAGRTYLVEPVADYELWGLVMSRNNPRSMADAYHDSRSVDTRDLCVVWGPNLEVPLRRVSVKNTSWTCWVRWPRGVDFDTSALSNNHLITDSDALRDRIEQVRPGDQVRLRGMLVNYSPEDQPTWRRTTSTVRTDDGGHACEVVFVEELEVLRRGTPVAYALAGLGKWVLVLALFGKLALTAVGVARDAGALEPR
jgi:hypothetical protein